MSESATLKFLFANYMPNMAQGGTYSTLPGDASHSPWTFVSPISHITTPLTLSNEPVQ